MERPVIWRRLGSVRGPDGATIVGPKGPKGDKGDPGESIVGPRGEGGPRGATGPAGRDGFGLPGVPGDKGDKGDPGLPGQVGFLGGGGGGGPDISVGAERLGRAGRLIFEGLTGSKDGSTITISATGGAGSDANYVHDQLVAASTWTVDHNLGKFPAVTVVDSSGDVCVGDIHYVSANRVTLAFGAAFSGQAIFN